MWQHKSTSSTAQAVKVEKLGKMPVRLSKSKVSLAKKLSINAISRLLNVIITSNLHRKSSSSNQSPKPETDIIMEATTHPFYSVLKLQLE